MKMTKKRKKKRRYLLENGIRIIASTKQLKKLCGNRMLFFAEGLPIKPVLPFKLAEIKLNKKKFRNKVGTKRC